MEPITNGEIAPGMWGLSMLCGPFFILHLYYLEYRSDLLILFDFEKRRFSWCSSRSTVTSWKWMLTLNIEKHVIVRFYPMTQPYQKVLA